MTTLRGGCPADQATGFDRIARRGRVVVEHLDRVQGKLIRSLPTSGSLASVSWVTFVGEDLERHGPVRHGGEYRAGERLVVVDPRLPHQGPVRRESLDEWIRIHLHDAGQISTVGKDLDTESL